MTLLITAVTLDVAKVARRALALRLPSAIRPDFDVKVRRTLLPLVTTTTFRVVGGPLIRRAVLLLRSF